MRSICLCIVFLLYVLQTHAQIITGKVYRLGTSTVIAGASVYYGGSMMGTSTDNNGSFQIQAQARQIPIIVSSIGYYSATATYKQGEPLIVYLKPKTEVLRAVTIRVDGMSRKDKIAIFKREFIGTSTFAESCTITNIDDIDLFYSKRNKTLTASCDKPIIIENKKLGYTISYFLDSFSWTTRNVSFVGNFIFKENIPVATDSVKIKRNRETAYKNSRMQLIRALWNHQLKQAGFKLAMLDTVTRKVKRPTAEQILVMDTLHQQYVHLDDKLYIINDLLETSTVKPTERFSFINKDGFYGAGLQWSGAMAEQRMGDLLPFEYRSERELRTPEVVAPVVSVASPVTYASPRVVASKDSEFSVSLFFEKAYLHTDRDVYGQGEDIWFKAYVVNAQNNTPIDYSHNLYVELIGPKSKLIRRETIRLENGLGNGDFKLTATIPAGNYRIRAYTSWMRNFGDNFVFEKHITVLQTAKAATVATTKKNKRATVLKTATAVINAPAVTVNFYPEGGSLVEGISSIVGVKAGDGYGKGIAVKGLVLSSAGDTVSRFTCDSLGMGMLILLPINGLSYRAIVNAYDGLLSSREYKGLQFNLPPALSKGLTLQVRQTDSVVHLVINSSGLATADKAYLAVKHGGKTQLGRSLQLRDQQTAIKIPTASLSEGISAITLYDGQGKPECERLVYIHHPDSKNILRVATDKTNYQPNGQVTVNIKTLPNANLSLAAVDAVAVPVQAENIISYLNLQSEIKGVIEAANRYFDTTNVNRFKQLDELLLTQGWRNFIWRRLEDTTLKLTYKPEQGIIITGRVRRVGVNKGLPGMNVTMYAQNAQGPKLFSAVTDSTGRFAIYTRFYGYQFIHFNSRKPDKINKNGESKGNSGGYIQVDSLLRDTLAIGPGIPVSPTDTSRLADEAIERIRKSLNLKDDHNLKEVTIKAYTNLSPPEIHPITLTEQKDYSNLAQYLLYMVNGARLSWDGLSRHIATFRYSYSSVPRFNGRFFTIDGSMRLSAIPLIAAYENGSRPDRYLDDELLTLPMSNVLKVTINKGLAHDVMSVNLVIRSGVLEPKDYFDNTVADMVGYYKAREFYKPRFENPGDMDTRTSTIHWEPNITTNAIGNAVVSFYNTAHTGNIRLVVEGITRTGTPLASTIGYVVK